MLQFLFIKQLFVSPLAISAGVCLFDIIRCFAKVITDMLAILMKIMDLLAILMKITEAGLELSRSELCNIRCLSFHSISYIFSSHSIPYIFSARRGIESHAE